MEFWFADNDNKEKLRLPVPPPDFNIETGQTVNVVEVNDFGEYSIVGNKKLGRITIKSFFPNQYYPFCQYRNFKKPYEFVNTLEKWKDKKLPIRFLITGTAINNKFFIETFNYGERAGSRDVEFEITLVEYSHIAIKKYTNKGSGSDNGGAKKNPSKPARTYTVIKGDTLWDIARRFYGDPYRWKDIASKNGIKDPRKLQIGTVLVLP